jgi:DNA-binding CsgD family transcriptional regulator
MGEPLGMRDLCGLADVVVEGRRDEPTEGLPWTVLHGLAALIPCDGISFYEADITRSRTRLMQWIESGAQCITDDCDPPGDAHFWASARQFAPCHDRRRTRGAIGAVAWSDCYSPSQLRNAPLFADFYGPHGWRHGMHLSFPALPGHMRKITFWRGAGSDFTDRDHLVAEVLRPHLWEIHAEGQRRRAVVPRLTDREWEVLELVHHGYSNVEIARHLFVSVSTVRKHLEHVFTRTGARTRTAAATLMMSHHGVAAALITDTAPLQRPS